MTLTPRHILIPVTLLALLAVAGCAGNQSREEAKAAANDRWSSARSNISYSLAQQQFDVGDLDKAEKTISEAIATRPEEARYYDLAARISMERGELERAFRQLEHSIALDDERYEPYYFRGVIQQRWQRPEQALESYETAFKHRPDNPTPLLAVSEMLVKLDRTDEAIERLEERTAYFANNAAIRTTAGRLHMKQHNYGPAVRAFREASVLAPEDHTIHEHLAMAEFADGNYGEAIRALTQLLNAERNRDRVDLKIVLGDAFMATENPVQARQIFLELTQEDPNDVNAWIKLAQAAWMVGDDSRLNQATSRVIALAPRRHEGHLLRGMIAHRQGQPEQAVGHFQRAAELAPGSSHPLILQGMAQENAGDTDAAREAYEQALEIAPDDPRARQLLAGLTS